MISSTVKETGQSNPEQIPNNSSADTGLMTYNCFSFKLPLPVSGNVVSCCVFLEEKTISQGSIHV